LLPQNNINTDTHAGTEIGYRWATEVSDEQFVSPGPTSNPRLQAFLRSGCYSDDGNSCLALAESLLEHGGVVGAEVASAYAKAWKSTPTRGYPPTAKAVMDAVLKGTDYRLTGLPPHFAFAGGSFANGAAPPRCTLQDVLR